MSELILLLNALVAVPQIAGYVQQAVTAVLTWWIQRQKAENLAAISDALALGARAQTDEERYAAAQAWQTALSQSRIIN